MSEHQKHTEFLRRCLLYDESSARHQLEEKFTRIQRDMRCVQRAAWLMAILTALAVAGLAYAVVLVDNFPYDISPFIINMICALGVGSLISLLVFLGLGMFYGRKLNEQREECRELVTRLLESRLGRPVIRPLPQVDNEATGSQAKVQSGKRA